MAADQELSPADAASAGPALAGDRVVYGRRSGERSTTLFERPIVGGPITRIGRFSVPPAAGGLGDSTLDGAAGGIALRLSGRESRRGLLFAGPLPGRLVQFGSPLAADDNPGEVDRPVRVVEGGVITVEPPARQVLLHQPGRRARRVPTPAGADLSLVDAAGTAVAFAIAPRNGLRSIVLVDLRTGATRTIAPGRLAGDVLSAIGIGADGSVAASSGEELVGFAAPGEAQLSAFEVGPEARVVKPAQGRIAIIVRTGFQPTAGERVVVVRPGSDPRRPVVDYRGPPTTEVGDDLAFDGRWLAWASGGCHVLTDTAGRSAPRSLPAGACVQTEATAYSGLLAAGQRTLRVRLRCLTAPGGRCRVRLLAYEAGGVLGRAATRVRQGTSRAVTIRLTRAAVRRKARLRTAEPLVVVRMTDPNGRARLGSGL